MPILPEKTKKHKAPARLSYRKMRHHITPAAESAYKVELTLAASDANDFAISFSEPVNPNDSAPAVNTVSGCSHEWAESNQAVAVTYDAPVAPCS